MDTEIKSQRPNNEAISHIVTGIVVILKGVDKVEHPDKLWLGIILILIGALISSIGLFHHRVEHYIKNIKPFVFLCESAVMGIVGYIYMHDNKAYIQYACFAASVGFLIAAILNIAKKKK